MAIIFKKARNVRYTEGKPNHILIMHVIQSNQLHANQADEVYYRVGDKSKKMNFEQRTRLMYAKGGRFFEDTPVRNRMVHRGSDEGCSGRQQSRTEQPETGGGMESGQITGRIGRKVDESLDESAENQRNQRKISEISAESAKKSADNFLCRFLKPSYQTVGKILVGNKMWNKLSLNARKQGVLDRFKEMNVDEHVSR
ncbi:MAG: hypothetical protein LUI13_08225 [Lachnospiraceae bacterium]|nr:hypothetical protein [Lachnospiraceae bacterium]